MDPPEQRHHGRGANGPPAALTASRTIDITAVTTMVVLGLAVGLTIVPQQHRIFSVARDLAAVAVGLNGSAIYIGSALGAGLGGIALAAGGSIAPTITGTMIGLLAVVVAATVVRRA